ncbi:hypothetical protein, partial [Rhizobium phaseoli]|uniref:hypothetical protein n=1 Tax=Rhizobium phaseoli TaxID=396 RepID=UPI001AEF3197
TPLAETAETADSLERASTMSTAVKAAEARAVACAWWGAASPWPTTFSAPTALWAAPAEIAGTLAPDGAVEAVKATVVPYFYY